MQDDDREALLRLPYVSRETLHLLDAYSGLLSKWNRKINLVSRHSEAEIWRRHFLDSAQIFGLLPDTALNIVDFGSGGGLPALVLAIISKSQEDNRQYQLIESDQRKTAFLRTVSRELNLDVNCLAQRIEQADPMGADLVTSRAFAPLDRLLPLAKRHLKPDGALLLLKGKTYPEELAKAGEKADFSVEIHPSIADSEGVVIRITDLELTTEA